jgi:hypothetical protein
MMCRQTGDQSQLFYLFNLEERVPAGHLLRRISPIVERVLADLREELVPSYMAAIGIDGAATNTRRLDHDAPGVSASIHEGLDEMLTVIRLGLPDQLRRSLGLLGNQPIASKNLAA